MTSGPRGDGLYLQSVASKVLLHLSCVCPLVFAVAARDSDSKGKVVHMVMEIDADDGPRAQRPPRNGRLAQLLGARSEEVVVDKGAIGGLVLDHDDAVLVDVYAEMDVADPAQRVIDEDDVAPSIVPPKDEAVRRVLGLARQPQQDGVVAMVRRVGLEAARVVLEFVVGLDAVGLVLADDEGRPDPGQLLDLVAGALRVRIQHADNVRDVFVGEA